MYSVELYRRLQASEHRRAGSRAAASSSPRARSGSRRSAGRSAGRRRTACRCTRSRPDEAAERFPLIGIRRRRRRGATSSPTASSTRRSSATRSRRRARRRRPDLPAHPGARHRRRGRGRVRAGVAPTSGTIDCEVVVNCGGMFAAEIGRLAGVRHPDRADVAPVRRHRAVPRSRDRRALPDAARPRPARLLPAGGRRAGRWAATSATRRRGPRRADATTRSRPTSTAGCCRRTGRGSRRSRANAQRRVPAHGRHRHPPGDQRPGGVHARQRVLPR